MAYMRGEWYVYATEFDDGEYMAIHGPSHIAIPMAIFDQLVMLRWAEMTQHERLAAGRAALDEQYGNVGTLALKAALEGKTSEEVWAEWHSGLDALVEAMKQAVKEARCKT